MLNQKGQIFSLDFILSLAIIILAIGMMLQFMELQEYNQREAEIQNELYSIGETASLLLVSNPAFTCQMTNTIETVDLMPVMGCILIGAPPSHEITRDGLGIPSDYSCEIYAEGITRYDGGAPSGDISSNIITECTDDFGTANPDNYYSSEREVVFVAATSSENIHKSELYHECVKGEPPLSCGLESGTIEIRVWKT